KGSKYSTSASLPRDIKLQDFVITSFSGEDLTTWNVFKESFEKEGATYHRFSCEGERGKNKKRKNTHHSP
uniref:Uncharacterized protein n=1 Tax=Megaselia scalaris TaxID=36166 RepID=T1GEM6_MEGSC